MKLRSTLLIGSIISAIVSVGYLYWPVGQRNVKPPARRQDAHVTHLPARVDATTNDRRAVTAPFMAGGRLCRLGHRGNLGVCVSTDKGETWSEVGWLTKGQSWHQSACNVWYARGNVYLVMERMVPSPDGRKFGWGVNRLAPVLMRAKETDDMTDFRSLVY